MTAVLEEIRFDTWVIPYLQLVIHVIHHFDKVVGYISAFCSPALISLLPFVTSPVTTFVYRSRIRHGKLRRYPSSRPRRRLRNRRWNRRVLCSANVRAPFSPLTPSLSQHSHSQAQALPNIPPKPLHILLNPPSRRIQHCFPLRKTRLDSSRHCLLLDLVSHPPYLFHLRL